MSRNPAAAASRAAAVAADMSARAPALAALVALAAASAAAAAALQPHDTHVGEEISCGRDGLYADYDTECRDYVKCAGGGVAGRFSCRAGRAFSESLAACVPRRRQPCTRRVCAPGDTLAYATPGSACRYYYRCDNGTAVDHSCPFGAWFDLDRQACTRGAGTCYEPLCAGLPDGSYPDSSHECRRTLRCVGGELRAVSSCAGGPCVPRCPPPRAAAVPLPAGDADFCSDEACSSLCQNIEDGAYADRSAACREYFVCESRRVIRRGVCEPGLIFSRGGCVPAAQARCPPPARSPCFNRGDGLHRDWRDCSSWFNCRRERVVARGACDPGLVFDGSACVPAESFSCEGPHSSLVCEGLPSGTYQDFESNCTKYFHCEGASKTTLSCPSGQAYNGARCVAISEYLCPSLESDSCYGRADGRYRAPDTGCRGFYSCFGGEKAVYACPAGKVFDGEGCLAQGPPLCPADDYSCARLSDGYHAELETGCRRYFYCEGGDRLATLSCQGGKIFDGQACVDPSHHECGAPRKGSYETGGKACERDGFFVQLGTECKRYYFCVTGIRTFLTCPMAQVFNGQVCVPDTQYTCPG